MVCNAVGEEPYIQTEGGGRHATHEEGTWDRGAPCTGQGKLQAERPVAALGRSVIWATMAKQPREFQPVPFQPVHPREAKGCMECSEGWGLVQGKAEGKAVAK